jgi:AraC-like DNA-binding protein
MFKLLPVAGLILGMIIVILLLFYRKRSINNSNTLLAISILCITYMLFINQLNVSREMLNYPVFARTGNLAGFLVIPFLYLYSRNSFYPGIKWKKIDWLLLIPALFYIIDLTPFFLSDKAYKISQIRANLDDQLRNVSIQEGWLGIDGFHYIFLYIWGIGLMVLQLRLIIRNKHILKESSGSMNFKLFWFIITFTVLHFPLIFPGIFGLIFHFKWYTKEYNGVMLSIHLIVSALFILFSPRILYGFFPQMDVQHFQSNADVIDGKPANGHAEINKFHIPEEELNNTVEKMNLFMDRDKPFLNPNYSIHDLSRDINVPVYQLSPLINNYFQSNFNTWLNKFRVEYFIQISQGDEKKGLTLDAIAKEAGFTNRTTFTNAFKKEKGTTPGQFVKNNSISY